MATKKLAGKKSRKATLTGSGVRRNDKKRDANLAALTTKVDKVNYYCYILVRRDLPQPVQTVQAAHAAQEVGYLSARPPTPTHFVILGVSGQEELKFYAKLLMDKGVRHHMFYEPDYDTGYTALCTFPEKGKIDLLKHLTLLGKPV